MILGAIRSRVRTLRLGGAVRGTSYGTCYARVVILLIGGGGIPNYGDELIINNWLDWYQNEAASASRGITVEGYSASVLRNTFADRFPKAKWSQDFRKARLNFRKESFWDALSGGLSSIHSSIEAVQTAVEGARNSSLVHIHGGGYINRKWPSHAFVVGLAAAVRANAGVPAVATGIGLSPLPDPDAEERKYLDQALDAFEYFEVRDEWSFEFLQRNLTGDRKDRVVRGLDDAFLQPVAKPRTDHKTLHLSLRDDAAGDSIIDRLTNRFVGSFERHRFWVCKPSDAASYARLSNKFRTFELAGTTELVENPNIGSQDVMITERFHPHLQAARVGVSGMYWSGSDYYDTKHGSLVDLGSPFIPDTRKEFKRDDFAGGRSKLAERDGALTAQKQELARKLAKLA